MSVYRVGAPHRLRSVSLSTRLAHKSLAFSRDGIGTTARQLAESRSLFSPEHRGMSSFVLVLRAGQPSAIPMFDHLGSPGGLCRPGRKLWPAGLRAR